MKRTVAFLCLLLAVIPATWAMNDAEAVNMSGSLRMLSQRMMKNYLAIGADIRPDVALKQLDDSVALFEQRFLLLNDYAHSSAVRKDLAAIETIWLPHREKLLGTPDREQAVQLMKDNLALLKACNTAVETIAREAGVPGAEMVNIAGRQRMLSQKIAKAYFALYWRVPEPGLKQEFEDARTLFTQSLDKLLASPLNTNEINNALMKVQSQWRFSSSGFALDDGGRYVPTIISVTTESILGKMDDITGLYEAVMAAEK